MLHRTQTFKKSQIVATRNEAILFFYLSLSDFLRPGCKDIDIRMSFREKFAAGYRIFGLIVVILMIALGAFLLFGHYFDYVPWNIRIALALMLLSVGAFRIVNIGLKYKREKDEKEDI
jgi:hypothetical protein